MGGVSDLNINKWNQSTLFSRMIDFWKTDILTKWHIPYVTMVGRQFNSEMVIFLPGPFIVFEDHDTLKLFCCEPNEVQLQFQVPVRTFAHCHY